MDKHGMLRKRKLEAVKKTKEAFNHHMQYLQKEYLLDAIRSAFSTANHEYMARDGVYTQNILMAIEAFRIFCRENTNA